MIQSSVVEVKPLEIDKLKDGFEVLYEKCMSNEVVQKGEDVTEMEKECCEEMVRVLKTGGHSFQSALTIARYRLGDKYKTVDEVVSCIQKDCKEIFTA